MNLCLVLLKSECSTYNASLNGLPKISPKVFNLAGFSPYVRQLHVVFRSTGGWKKMTETDQIELKTDGCAKSLGSKLKILFRTG